MDPRSISTIKVRLKGKSIPDTDGYVKGISHLNSNLTVMPGLTHLRFNHMRQIYVGQIEIMNIGNTLFSFEKGSTVAKHIYVTEEDAEQTIAKPLDKRPVGECFEQLSKKLHQKKSDKGMYKDKLVNPKLQPQEDCHGMAKHMCNQGNWEFSGEIVFCAQCSLANILCYKPCSVVFYSI